MRNYWFKILLGALGIFAVGMIGVAIVRSGVAKVNSVVHSDEPSPSRWVSSRSPSPASGWASWITSRSIGSPPIR